MNSTFVQDCQKFVEELFSEKLSNRFLYHDINHTLAVKAWCKTIGLAQQLPDSELEILIIAALFHDTGFTQVYQGHEEASKKIAAEYLKNHDYPSNNLEKILQCIEATKMDHMPDSNLEEIIKDADLNSLGTPQFFQNSENLRREWADLCKEEYTDISWLENNIDFMSQHQYFTAEARELLGKTKKKNYKKIIKTMESEIKRAQKKKDSESISGNRSAQMMFKVSLRNHIDLTNIADNKANIMLSINMAVLTFGIPIGAGYIEDYPYLIFPIILLATTSLLTIIYATLATRPIKMQGTTSPENLATGKTNLFFFGNFYNMSLPDYQEGIKNIIKHEDRLETTIINDLYFLGKALGKKYNQLRKCYMIFVIGITITVLAFAISFYLAPSTPG